MNGPQTIDPAAFGPCSGLALDSRDNQCGNFAAEFVEFAPTELRDNEGVFATGRTTRRLCTPCADAAPDVMSRQPLTTKPGGYPVEGVTSARPVNVAVVDAEMVDAADTLDDMVASYRRGSVEFNVDRAARYLLMSRATVDTYDHFEVAKLLAVAVARLGDLPTAPPTVPAGPHAVAVVLGSGDSYTAVCVCSKAFIGTDDYAVTALDAHIADPGKTYTRIGDLARGEILAWLNAEPRSFTDILGMLWCRTVTETGGVPVEIELLDGSHLVSIGSVWIPKAGA